MCIYLFFLFAFHVYTCLSTENTEPFLLKYFKILSPHLLDLTLKRFITLLFDTGFWSVCWVILQFLQFTNFSVSCFKIILNF